MYKVNNELIDDKELALEVAKKYRQLSIFDLNTKKELYSPSLRQKMQKNY